MSTLIVHLEMRGKRLDGIAGFGSHRRGETLSWRGISLELLGLEYGFLISVA